MRIFFVGLSVVAVSACYGGQLTDTPDSIRDHDLAGIAGPPDLGNLRPVERVPRALWGSANTADALAFPSLPAADRHALFDPENADAPLHFFTVEHTAEEGMGPIFNQTRCLGCHGSAADNAALDLDGLARASTPGSRAGRVAVTVQEEVAAEGPPATEAVTVFGDYAIADGTFDPLTELGGPTRQVRAQPGCAIDPLPPEPNLSDAGMVRAIGERAAPSYVGRGLIEAIYAPDIAASADPADELSSTSSLVPAPSCSGDCISGRPNEGRASDNIQGGDPLRRLGRFGLRAAAPSLLELVAAGATAELGFTSPLVPLETESPWNAGLGCDASPDPEQSLTALLALRDLIRNLAPPEPAASLLRDTPADAAEADVHAGAALFGVDLEAFRSRLRDGDEPVRFGDADADRAVLSDRNLNCVGCHTPIMITGASPAAVGAAQLSNRWAPIFSDLLLHDMGGLPPDADGDAIESTHPHFEGIARSLADFVLPGHGLASGTEWRTAPLMALGVIGAPFLHDARVFLNPSAPVHFYYGSRTADEAGLGLEARRLEITSLDTAIRAAIELHDLPQPPDADLDGTPDYDACPDGQVDWCSRNSSLRSEARNALEKWHALTDGEQAQVIAFVRAL